jgi:hypothetical protein
LAWYADSRRESFAGAHHVAAAYHPVAFSVSVGPFIRGISARESGLDVASFILVIISVR